MKIVFCADCHLKNFNYKRTRYGVSERSLDLINQVALIGNYAINEGAKILVIAGDVYDKTTINPNVKRLFRKSVLLPLLKKKVKVLIIGGNHDSHKELTYGCDIEELNMANDITVKRNFGVKKYKIDGEKIGFITFPFLMPESVFDYHMNVNKELTTRDVIISPQMASEYIQMIVPTCLNSLDGMDQKIMVGHYHVVGTRVTNLPVSFALKEIEFDRSMIREHELDLAVFGHIHIHQHVGDKIVIPGSIERINFGERNNDKYFIDYDTDTGKWKPIKLECRNMVQIDVDVSNNESDPTGEILSLIKDQDLNEAIVKIAITTTRSVKKKIDQYPIERSLQHSFHPLIEYKVLEDNYNPMVDLSGLNLDPESLLESFVEMKYGNKSDSYKKKLLNTAKSYMRD